MTFSIALKQLRKELNLKQKELAGLLNLNVTTVNRWETGKSMPNRSMCTFLIATAKEKGASSVCLSNLHDTLFLPAKKDEKTNDLRYTQIDTINKLANDAVIGILVVGIDNNEILYANDKAVEMTGNRIDDLLLIDGKEFQTEYTSPATGRHYLINSNMSMWRGQKAQIKYLTDITKRHQLQQEAREKQQALNYATEFAQMQVFEYDIKNDSARLISRRPEDIKLPEKINNLSEAIVNNRMIVPEHVDEYKRMLKEIREGALEVKIEVQTNESDGRTHWTMFQMNQTKVDEAGSPVTAICTVRFIDREKSLENRIRFEHEKILRDSNNLFSFVVTNLTENKVIESMYLGKYLDTDVFSDFDKSSKVCSEYILTRSERKLFLRNHNRADLIDKFLLGESISSQEYQVRKLDGYSIWVKNTMELYGDAVNGDIYLYEYCFDINEKKLFDVVLQGAMHYQFDMIGVLSLPSEQLTLITYLESEERHFTEVTNYIKAMERFCNSYVYEDDKMYFRKITDINEIIDKLNKHKVYSNVFRIKEQGGVIRKQLLRMSWFNRETQTCLISSVNLEEGL